MTTLFVGADIAMKTVQLHWQDSKTGKSGSRSIKQTPSGYRTLVERLDRLAPADQTHVLMEATGNYWLRFALALHEAGCQVSVINPRQAYYFAHYQARQTKTDEVDAALLCQMVQQNPPDLWTPPPAVYHDLRQRLTLRQNLQDSRTQYQNRLHALRYNPHARPEIIAFHEAFLLDLETHIKQLDKEIDQLLNQSHDWHEAARHLLSIKGIGPIVAGWILVATHAFERCDTPEQAASFAGLVPHAYSSGQSRRKRSIGHGHRQLRVALYMAAGAALQHNPPIRAFYQRLLKHGKIKQVARIAAARKLIHIAWACVTKKRDFDPNYGKHSQAA